MGGAGEGSATSRKEQAAFSCGRKKGKDVATLSGKVDSLDSGSVLRQKGKVRDQGSLPGRAVDQWFHRGDRQVLLRGNHLQVIVVEEGEGALSR